MIKAIINFFRKGSKSKEEIYKRAFESFPFDYKVVSKNDRNINTNEVSFSDATRNLPSETFDLKQVDYYA